MNDSFSNPSGSYKVNQDPPGRADWLLRPAQHWRRLDPRFVRVPTHWLLFLIAPLNAMVVVILGALIWNSVRGLNSEWDDVRKVRESDRLLTLLEGEASHLQNLIHRYINGPSQELLKQIIGLRGTVLYTVRNRVAADPVLSAWADELGEVNERFLQGFDQVREVQERIAQTYEYEIIKLEKEIIELYGVIEGAVSDGDISLLRSLAKSREAFTTSLVAAHAFHLSPTSDAADVAQRNIATVEQSIADLAGTDLQRATLIALADRAASFGEGMKLLADQFAARARLLKTEIDDNEATMLAVVTKLSAQMTLDELQAQGSFERTLASIYENVALGAVILLLLIAGLLQLQRTVAARTRALANVNHQLSMQGARLRRANAFKNEFLDTVAHDLKNPLGVILGRAEILREMVGDIPWAHENAPLQIDHIRAAAKRLIGMVDDLLVHAMTDALNITIKRETVDIALLAEEVVETNRPLAARKNQTIRITVPPNHSDTCLCSCDADRIREGIDNLISNAVKYSPLGVPIDLSVCQESDALIITVRDQGPGLSSEDISRLFGRFQRLSAKPTAGESSTGLGLSIVKHIVELHGGQITAESAGPGKGATFRMTLPQIS